MLSTLVAFVSLAAPQADPVVFSFAFFGCNRVDKKDWDPQANPSSANLVQLRQTLKDVAAVQLRPSFLFAGGDLVNNYADDQGQTLRSQLDAWAKEAKLPSGMTLVPMPGNHELNKKVGDEKLANLPTDIVWTDWLSRNHYPPRIGNGPKAGGADNLADDQSRLSYSFDAGAEHFVVLNTDTRTTDGKIAMIPVAWAKADIDRAQVNPRVRHIFVLGHRNLVDPDSVSGDAPIDAGCVSGLLDVMKKDRKVAAYVCAHVHAYDLKRLTPNGAWQVVSGHGGSKLEKGWQPARGRTFGFVVIQVHRSGKVGVVGYQRPAPEPYNKPEAEPAKPDTEVPIAG